MATPEPSPPSTRLRSAASAEHTRLLREIARHQARIARRREELADHEGIVEELQRQLADLAPFIDIDAQPTAPNDAPARLRAVNTTTSDDSLPPPHGYLHGADIRITAVRVRAAANDPTKPLHHSDWFRMLCGAGYGVAGQDAQASFLTQLARSPVVQRAGERGLYMLDVDAPRRLRERLRALHEELAALHQGQQTIENIASAASRRLELANEAIKIDRELQEAARSLFTTELDDDN